MKYIAYILIGFLSAFVANVFGYNVAQQEYWLIALPIIVFGNLIVYSM